MEMATLINNTMAASLKEATAAINRTRPLTKEELIANAKESIRYVEERNWQMGYGYEAPSFPLFTQKLEGLESGLYLFAGESNCAKTGLMLNIFWDLVLHSPNKLYGIYFSLDDAKTEIYPRVIAMQQTIPIGCVKKPRVYEDKAKQDPNNYSHYLDFIAKRKVGYDNLIEQAEHFSVFDASNQEDGCANEQDMYDKIKKIQEAVRNSDPDASIIVVIDAIDDIRLKTEVVDRAEEIAKTVKRWTVDLDIPIFCSKHLKKINGNRRPILDDLRDSNTLVYEASVVFLIFNDVSKNKQQAKVFYLSDDGETKQPIVEMDWAKNKKSSYKGITFCHFIPDYSKASECTEAQGKHYESSIYSL